MRGKIVKFVADKGYGFVSPDSGEADVFVHIRAFGRAGVATPEPGDTIEFDIARDADGRLRAIDAKLIASNTDGR